MTKLSRPVVKRFFAFLQERESIRLRKLAGEPWPWTKDKILQTYSFTNVKREHDRTSQLLIQEFYKPNFDAPREQLLLNCALARYFGTIEFMRAIGWQTNFKPAFLKKTVRDRAEAGLRVFTGAYIITSGNKPGPKENTVVDHFIGALWNRREKLCWAPFNIKTASRQPWTSWQAFIEALMEVPGFGGSGFMAKEVCLDTRYTSFWPEQPRDMNTWTPIGPGSKRGAARLQGYTDKRKASPEDTLAVCRELFGEWFNNLPARFIALELHDIQFQLCEFDKMERVRLGQGRPRSRYHHISQLDMGI